MARQQNLGTLWRFYYHEPKNPRYYSCHAAGELEVLVTAITSVST